MSTCSSSLMRLEIVSWSMTSMMIYKKKKKKEKGKSKLIQGEILITNLTINIVMCNELYCLHFTSN